MARYYDDTKREVPLVPCPNCSETTNLLQICRVCGFRFCSHCGGAKTRCPGCGEWGNTLFDENLGDPEGPSRKTFTPSVTNQKPVERERGPWVVCGTCEGWKGGKDGYKPTRMEDYTGTGVCQSRSGEYLNQEVSVDTPAPPCWDYSPYFIETDTMTPKSPDLLPLIQELGRKARQRQ